MSHVGPMAISIPAILLIIIMLLVSGATKGLLGIGMAVVALPLLSFVMPVPIAVTTLSIPLVLTNFLQAIKGDKLTRVFVQILPITIGMTIGVLIGVHLLENLSPSSLKRTIGVALIAVSGLLIASPRLSVTKGKWLLSPAAGFAGGVMGGLAAQPGPIVFMYLLSQGLSRDQFVQYSSMYIMLTALFVATVLKGTGAMSASDMAYSAVCTIPVLVGMWAGGRIRNSVPAALFRNMVLGIVIVSGASLIARTF